MRYKKSIIIGASVAILGIIGVSVAATHSNPQTAANKVQSVSVQEDTTGNSIAVTTDSAPTQEPVTSTDTSPDTSTDILVAPTTSAPLAQFQQDVTSKVQGFASYFVPAYAPDTATFIQNQVRCASRGLDDSTNQAVFDAKLSYFEPYTNDQGNLVYRFYTGGCQPVFTPR